MRDVLSNYGRPPSRTVAHIRGIDEWGSGTYLAPRGSRSHNGTDFLIPPHAIVYAACSGTVTKHGLCYRGEDYRYLQITDTKGNHIRHFYVLPAIEVGTKVSINEPIGFLQDLQLKYRKGDKISQSGDAVHQTDIPSHMHLEVMRHESGSKVFFDPLEYDYDTRGWVAA